MPEIGNDRFRPKAMPKKYITLGLNYGGHDTAAALMVDNQLVAACEEERYTRQKHSREFPINAIRDCLKSAEIEIHDVDRIAFGYDPVYHIREAYLREALSDDHRLSALVEDRERIAHRFATEDIIRSKTGFAGEIDFLRHHECHLASAYYPSGFSDALVTSYDGIGEIESGYLAIGREGSFQVVHKGTRFPHSLGLIYSAVTHFLGWKHHCDEGIVMGLATYGNPYAKVSCGEDSYIDIFREIIQVVDDFDYRIDESYITYHVERDTWISPKFLERFGQSRASDHKIEQKHKDLAAALQLRLEEVVMSQLVKAKETYKLSKLCLSGGVALNCSMNGKIEQSQLFEEIFIQPASGDAGVALGACLISQKKQLTSLSLTSSQSVYLGSSASEHEIRRAFERRNLSPFKPEDVFRWTADRLASGKIVGWFQGRAEFGPRALGNRSILTRPYPAQMKDYLNSRVKFRESFRPFAPAVLEENQSEYFSICQSSPHMLIAAQATALAREKAPAIVHVDNSCRVQSVNRDTNLRFYKLISAFKSKTDCAVILNTSFNVKGQPIVNVPSEAVDCFLSTNIDCLVVGDYVIEKDSMASDVVDVNIKGKTSAWSHFGANAQTYGDDYKEIEHKKYPANRYRLHIVKEILSSISPRLILDLGCGTGEPLIDFLKSGLATKGVDKSPKMIEKCKENLEVAKLDPTLVSLGDMERPEELPQDSFDCLVALGAVYYAEKFEKTMRGLSNILPDGGHFIFSLRNELFSLFSMNKYTKTFFQNHLIPYESFDAKLRSRVDAFLSERFERLEQKRKFETVDTMGVHSITHNPLTIEENVLAPAGLDLISLSFYHYHPLPPIFEHTDSEVFRALADQHEKPNDWRGYLMASAFVVHARKRSKSSNQKTPEF